MEQCKKLLKNDFFLFFLNFNFQNSFRYPLIKIIINQKVDKLSLIVSNKVFLSDPGERFRCLFVFRI